MGKTAVETNNLDTYFMQLHSKWAEDLVDQTIENNNVLFALRELGKFKSYTDLVDLKVRVKHELITGQTYSRRGKIDITKHDPETMAEWKEKHMAWSIVYYYHDIINTGSSRLYDVFEEQSKMILEDAPKMVEDQILGSGTPSSTEVEGLEFVLSNATNVNTVGRIDRSSAENDWWRHRAIDFSSLNFSTQGLSAMQQLYTDLTLSGSPTDLIIAHDDVFNAIHDLGFANSVQQGLAAKMLAMGFDALRFKQATIINSPKVPTGKMYFLYSPDFDIMVNSNDDMNFHQPSWDAERPGDRVFPITKTMNIKWNRLRKQGVIHSITVNKQTIT